MAAVHIFDERVYQQNLALLTDIQNRSGAKFLLALKGYVPFHSAELTNACFAGIASSSLYESIAADKYFTGEKHLYCPAYDPDTFADMVALNSHVVFNSHQDHQLFKGQLPSEVAVDLRVNVQHEMADDEIFHGYNPNRPYSRFGITQSEFKPELLDGVTGIHLHALCGQSAEDLVAVLDTFDAKFGPYMANMQRLNIGGGHAITEAGYNVGLLVETLQNLANRYDVEVYMEPSEWVYHKVGVLETKVLSLIHNDMDIAILDCSAKAHMPDVLESDQYNVDIEGAIFGLGHGPYEYRIGGCTCLTGDVIGDYSFAEPLEVGQTLRILDQTQYTWIQTTRFNGVPMPSLRIIGLDGEIKYHATDSFKLYKSNMQLA